METGKGCDLQRDFKGLRKLLSLLAAYTAFAATILWMFGEICNKSSCDQSSYILLNLAVQLGLIISVAYVIKSMVTKFPASIWTPAVMFPSGLALFFGFGSLSTFLASDETISLLLLGNYSITAEEQVRTNLLTFIGISFSLFSMVTILRFRLIVNAKNLSKQRLPIPVVASFFLIFGFVLKYVFIVPNDFGLTNYTIPGTLKSLTMLIDLGFALVAYLAAQGGKRWAFILVIGLPLHVGFCILEFSKMNVIFALLLPVAGAYLAHGRLRKTIIPTAIAIVAFVWLQDFNTAGRLTIFNSSGSIMEATYSERLTIARGILENEISLKDAASLSVVEAQVWWLRLNYSGAQLRGMELFEAGMAGEWSLSLLQALIPRFLWPSKPMMNAQGREFNRIVSGNEEASAQVGITVFADGYWQLGWPGLVLFSVLMGCILGYVARICYWIVLSRDLIYLPVVFLGMRMALLGPTGVLQKAFIGAFPILLGYILLISLLLRFLRAFSIK